MTRRVRQAIAILYGALLLGGGAFALLALADAYGKYGEAAAQFGADWMRYGLWRVLQEGLGGLFALIVTAGYSYVYWRKGSNWFALLFFVISYALVGLVSSSMGLALGKDDYSDDVRFTLILGSFPLVLALALSFGGMIWAFQKSRHAFAA